MNESTNLLSINQSINQSIYAPKGRWCPGRGILGDPPKTRVADGVATGQEFRRMFRRIVPIEARGARQETVGKVLVVDADRLH